MTLDQAIKKAVQVLTEAGIPMAGFDAELLMARVLGRDRTWVVTHIHDQLEIRNEAVLQGLVVRRAAREPLQQILGEQEFWGLAFTVTREVLIPRPETELVVEAALQVLRQKPRATVIDLCTGSGCIAVSLAVELPSPRIFAGDISEAALEVARENAARHNVNGRIRFLEGDLLAPFRELDLLGGIDVITANPPYIKSADLAGLQPEVRDFEPEAALIAGPSGTEIHERIITDAARFLVKGGALIMEMGMGQAEELIRLFDATAAYNKPRVLKDLAGIDRMITAEKRL